MKRFLSPILVSLFYFLSSALFAHADVSSGPIYGGGQMFASTGSIAIDKKVLNPQTNNLVDNLSINDPKYQPGNTIKFQINLTNTGNTEIKQIDVKDIFPQFVSFTSGPGNFDANTKTLSFEVNNLKPSETRTFTLEGKVVSEDHLPIDQGTVCMANQATAATTDSGMSQDNTLFCVQKEVLGIQATTQGGDQMVPPKGGFPVLSPLPITTTPATGTETLLLFSLLPTGIAGWILRKYSK